ncbi:MAG: hypothetical protein VX699_12360, partial [Myxococcota bacterium]|nr:hypothetical protein [Myxococcota bacterium]
GFPGGYCTVVDCEETPCPEEVGCFEVASEEPPLCLVSCASDADCRTGYECQAPGVCFPTGDGGTGVERCTETSCAEGMFCGRLGECLESSPDLPRGPVPDCAQAGPDWNSCALEGQSNRCDELIFMEPRLGDGYWDYPINGETTSNQYRSWLRRDLALLVQYAAGKTNCLSQGWSFGNRAPLGLGDMSEADGSIPGTSDNDPGHPEGSHTNGFDIDVAYFQTGTPDNELRSVCAHTRCDGPVDSETGDCYGPITDEYHCVEPPDMLDVWRTALYLGLLHESPSLRVIGVDGKVGPLVEAAFEQLCGAGWLTGVVCEGNSRLAYEVEDTGMGWFYFHHHHFHISLEEPDPLTWWLFPRFTSRCLSRSCDQSTVGRQATLEKGIIRLRQLR